MNRIFRHFMSIEKKETFLNHSEPILKCVYSLLVTFKKLNQATSKQLVSDCYTGRCKKLAKTELGILIRCKFESIIFVYEVVPSTGTRQIKFPKTLEQFSKSHSNRKFDQGHWAIDNSIHKLWSCLKKVWGSSWDQFKTV